MDTMMKKDYKKIILSSFFGNLCMERGIFIILLMNKGLSINQIAVWQAIINIGMFFAEVPTGFLADIFGKRQSLVAGKILISIYYFFLLVSNNYYILLLAAFIFGIGSTFISGTNEALLYDILLSKKDEECSNTGDYFGRFSSIIIISIGISMLIGGEIQKLGWGLLLSLCLIFQIISIIFVQSININETHRIDIKSTLYNYISAIQSEIKKMHVVLLILALGMNIGVISALYILSQNELSKFGFSISNISIFFAVESVLSFLVLFNIDKIKNAYKGEKSMIIVSIFSCLIFMLLSFSNRYLFMLAIISISLLNNYFTVIMVDRLNLMIDSKVRTTIMSVFNSISALMMAAIFFLTSKLGEKYNLFLIIAGVLSYILLIGYIYRSTNTTKVGSSNNR